MAELTQQGCFAKKYDLCQNLVARFTKLDMYKVKKNAKQRKRYHHCFLACIKHHFSAFLHFFSLKHPRLTPTTTSLMTDDS